MTIDRITMALASFQRTLLTGNSPYDRDKLGPGAARGRELFNGKANCAACHSGPDLSDGRFHNVGAGMQRRVQDLGRHEVTNADAERGAFRTPPLRNLAGTFPYMHDGSLPTLEEVVEFFDRAGYPNPWLSPLITPLGLGPREGGPAGLPPRARGRQGPRCRAGGISALGLPWNSMPIIYGGVAGDKALKSVVCRRHA